MVIALSIGLGIMLLMLIGAAAQIKKLQEIATLFDKEQHDQNQMIMSLMKENNEMKEMLLQHIEILKYLCDQDPILSKVRIPYTGPIGQA